MGKRSGKRQEERLLNEMFVFRFESYPANIYLFKVNYKNTRKKCEICSKLTIKTPERRH